MLVRNYRLDVEHQHLTDCINKQLIDLCKPDNPRTDFGDRAPKWVHMSPPKVVAKREARSVDGVHLSSRGYKGMANWVAADVEKAMLQVEFEHIKATLGGE